MATKRPPVIKAGPPPPSYEPPPRYLPREPQYLPAPEPPPMSNVAKFGLPIGAVVLLIWTIAAVIWTASGRVTTNESGLKELSNRMDQLEKQHSNDMQDLKHTIEEMHSDLSRRVGDDHDIITSMKSDIAAQDHNIDVMQRNQNNEPIKLSINDPAKSQKK